MNEIHLGELNIEVELKDIKNIHLSVYPPNGKVRVTAPARMDLETIRIFLVSKVGWIKQQQKKMLAQERETPREFLERETHYLWGDHYLLSIIETSIKPFVEVSHKQLTLYVRPSSGKEEMQGVLEAWYRQQIRVVADPLIDKWQTRLNVKLEKLFVQRMKTRWGSCTPQSRYIRLNTELAKKPRECLEYIIVHELAHLIEPSHNSKFQAIMDKYLPHWRQVRAELNRAPLGHVEWEY